ncbi:MAG: hypothetical protein IPK76_06580 [Lewinellaceae bacterium]|nr:hypothetical protein [Lewinellaceae bacterium]
MLSILSLTNAPLPDERFPLASPSGFSVFYSPGFQPEYLQSPDEFLPHHLGEQFTRTIG